MKEQIKQISMFDVNKYNERFSTVGSPMNEKQAIDTRPTEQPKSKTDELLKTLSSGNIDVRNINNTIEDLLKLVFIEQFNKDWNKYNYILRNIKASRSSDKGLCAVRSAAHLTLDKDKTAYSKDELKSIVIDFINRLIQNNEYMMMRELVRQFRKCVINSPNKQYEEYIPALRNASDQLLLSYFMSKEPDYLKENISIELHKPWKWLNFGPDKIMTQKYENEYARIYDINMINNASYLFENKFIENVLDEIKYINETNKGGTSEHGNYKDYRDFRSISNRKRESE